MCLHPTFRWGHFSALDHELYNHDTYGQIGNLSNIPFERSFSKLSENQKIVEIGSTEFKLWTINGGGGHYPRMCVAYCIAYCIWLLWQESCIYTHTQSILICHRCLVVLYPTTHTQFCEHLVLTYNDSSHLRLKLSGTGVQPDVSLTPDTNSYDLGHAMVRDTVSGLLQLTNHCPLAVRYQLSLESSLPGAAERRKKKGMPFSEYKNTV